MSTTTDQIQLGMSQTQSQNFKFLTGNDGTLTLKRNDNSQTILTVDATGIPTFDKQPVVPVQSMVRLNTANGFGSTNTVIRRFTNVVTNQGTDITYADSATLGATFTINTNGVYAIHYTEQSNTGQWFGPSLNSSQLTTAVVNIAIADVLSIAYLAANTGACAATTVYLPSGSVVRPHFNAVGGSATPAVTTFTITRVS